MLLFWGVFWELQWWGYGCDENEEYNEDMWYVVNVRLDVCSWWLCWGMIRLN